MRGMARWSSRSALLPTMTMGTFGSSLMRMISSRSMASSASDDCGRDAAHEQEALARLHVEVAHGHWGCQQAAPPA